jgi:hypothetical protein
MCYGQQRSALKANEPSQLSVLNIRYSGLRRSYLSGSALSSIYRNSRVKPVQPRDQWDAQSILSSQAFEVSR